MTHFAQIDKNNKVIRVIVAEQDFIDSGLLGDPSTWIQTSYNATIREKFAGVGDEYDPINDRFRPSKPYESWIWNEKLKRWEAPVNEPLDKQLYTWDEKTQSWVV